MLTPLSRPEIAARPGALPPFILLDAHGQEIQAISEYLRELTATDCSPATIKSYAYALLSWLPDYPSKRGMSVLKVRQDAPD
ncbi:hypothetical protein ACFPQ6_14700, partial [Deinococcus petrolearius]